MNPLRTHCASCYDLPMGTPGARNRSTPVLDADPTTIPVINRDGSPKTTKTGRAITMNDKAHPLPLRTCEVCREPIQIGSPYKQEAVDQEVSIVDEAPL